MQRQRCSSCGVKLTGERRVCPLCGRKLEDGEHVTEESYEIFPQVPVKFTYDLIFKITTFVGILAIIIINIINYNFFISRTNCKTCNFCIIRGYNYLIIFIYILNIFIHNYNI